MDKMEKRRGESYKQPVQAQGGEGLMFKILSTLLFMYVLTGLMLFGMAFLLYKFQLQETFVMMGIIVVYVVSGFAGGFLMAKRLKTPCGFIGLLLGTVYFLVLFAGSAILNHGLPEELLRMVAIWIMCACAGMLGGMISRSR